MKCEYCNSENEVKETEIGTLCETCYQLLSQENFDILFGEKEI